jgi:hypothetical protein
MKKSWASEVDPKGNLGKTGETSKEFNKAAKPKLKDSFNMAAKGWKPGPKEKPSLTRKFNSKAK